MHPNRYLFTLAAALALSVLPACGDDEPPVENPDKVAPAVTVDALTTNDATPTLTGTATDDTGVSSVTVTLGGQAPLTATLDGDKWSVALTAALADGTHDVAATATDAAGNAGTDATAAELVVDATAPAAPVLDTALEGVVTNVTTQTVSGSAEAASTVTLYDGEAALDLTVTAGADGSWAATLESLAEGAHVLTATAADALGNVGPASAALSFTLDTTAPASPAIDAPQSGALLHESPVFSGTAEPGSTVALDLDGTGVEETAVAAEDGSWSIAPAAALADGDHAALAVATDPAGNASPASASVSFRLDTTAPQAPAISSPSDGTLTNDSTPTFAGSAEAGATVTLFAGTSLLSPTAVAGGNGAWSLTPDAPLADGAHELTAVAADEAGNGSGPSAAITLTIDATAPAAPVVTAPADGAFVAADLVALEGTAEAGASVAVLRGGALAGTVPADGSGNWSFAATSLADGPHVFTATAGDAAGNLSEASAAITVTVDTAAPAAPAITAPAGGALFSAVPTFEGTAGVAEAGGTVTLFVDGVAAQPSATVAADGSWSVAAPQPFAEGARSITAATTDRAGNLGAASPAIAVTLDLTAPGAPSILAPADGTLLADAAPAFSGTGSEAGNVVTLHDGALALAPTAVVAADLTWTLTPGAALADGAHSVHATETDPAGNESLASAAVSLTVDTTAPAAPTLTAPANGTLTRVASVTVTGVAEAGSSVELLDNGASAATATADDGTFSVEVALTGEGLHELSARATDAAGNTGPASNLRTVTLDTIAPAAPALTPLASPTNENQPVLAGTVEASEAGAAVALFDGAVELPETGTVAADGTFAIALSTTTLAEGAHEVSARLTDLAGNLGETSPPISFVVDTLPPEPMAAPVDEGDWTSSSTLRASWAAGADDAGGTGVDHYLVSIRRTRGGLDTLLVVDQVVAALEFTWTDSVQDNDRFTFLVAAVDRAGNPGPAGQSDGITFSTSAPDPVARPVSTQAPATRLTPVVFTWPQLGAYTAYDVEVWRSGAIETVAAVAGPPFEQGVAGAHGDEVWVRVRARDGAITGPWSDPSDPVLIDTVAPSGVGVVADRGDFDDRSVQFTWDLATDADSGVAGYELFVTGSVSGAIVAEASAVPSFSFDAVAAGAVEGETLVAEVWARDVAGNLGPASLSDGVVLDVTAPYLVSRRPVPNTDGLRLTTAVVLQFSETMDVSNAATAVQVIPAPSAGTLLTWSSAAVADDELTLLPDMLPAGFGNEDFWQGSTHYDVHVSPELTDLAGNPADLGIATAFTTRDVTAPKLLRVVAGASDALTSAVAPEDVEAGDLLVFEFDEPMSPRARVQLSGSDGYAQARILAVMEASRDASGVATYVTWGDHGLWEGQFVTVQGMTPASFDAILATVHVLDSFRFTLDQAPAGAEVASGFGYVSAEPSDLALAWMTESQLLLNLNRALRAGEVYTLRVEDLGDLAGNWAGFDLDLQVRAVPGADLVAPQVVSTLPADGGAAARSGGVVIGFSESIDQGTLAGITVESEPAGAFGTADFQRFYTDERGDHGQFTAVAFLARQPLPIGASFRVTVPTSVADLSGNGLQAQVSFGFTVVDRPSAGPALAATVPNRGDQFASWEHSLSIAFADAATGAPEMLDWLSVHESDFRVFDETAGLELRGFRLEPSRDSGGSVLRLQWTDLEEPRPGHLYTVHVGPGIQDASGHPMDQAERYSFRFAAEAEPRSPYVPWLPLELSGQSGRYARSLGARMSVRSEQGGPITVTVQDRRYPAAGLSYSETINVGAGWSTEWRFGSNDGPPQQLTGMDAASYPTSGWYTFDVTLDDGARSNTYAATVWLWTPATEPGGQNPILGSIGGVPVDPAAVPVVSDPLPQLVWSNVDADHADWLQLYCVDSSILDDSDEQDSAAYLFSTVLPAGVDRFVLPTSRPLEAGVYLWALEQRLGSLFDSGPIGSGWSFDAETLFAQDHSPFFIYGPDNAQFGTTLSSEYGVGGATVSRSEAGYEDATGHHGTFTFDGVSRVHRDLVLNDGSFDSSAAGVPDWYGLASPELSITRGGNLAVAGKGWLGRGGDLFLQALGKRRSPAVTVGARRFQTSGFGDESYLVGTRWNFALFEVTENAGAFEQAESMVGSVRIDTAGVVELTRLIDSRGQSLAPPAPVPYTLDDAGYFSLTMDDRGTADPADDLIASGFIGGSPGARVLVLSSRTEADAVRFFVFVEAHDLPVGADLSGDYRFVEFILEQDAGTGFESAMAMRGTLTAQGGALEVHVDADAPVMNGTYVVDPAADMVTLQVTTPGFETNVLLFPGPDLDTLVGTASDPTGRMKMLIVLTK